MSVLVVPSSWIAAVTLHQFSELTRLVFCCNVQPVEGDGHVTATVLVVVWKIVSNGTPVGCVLNSPTHVYPGPVGVDIKCSMSFLPTRPARRPSGG